MADFSIKAIFTVEGLAEVNAQFKRIEKAAKDFGRSARVASQDVKTFGKNLGIAATAASAGIATAFSDFADFEKALVGVGKTTSLTSDELKELGENAETLSEELAISSEEFLNIAQTAGQLGVDGVKDLTNFSKVIAKLNTATQDLQGEEAAVTLSRLVGIAGEGIEGVEGLASVIVQLGNTFRATEGEIAATALEIQQAGVAFGFTTTESAGLAAAFAQLNIAPEKAGSTISKVMLEISEAINEGGEQLTEFQKITGLTAAQLATAFEDTPVDLLQKFFEGLQRINSEEGSLGLTKSLADIELNARTLSKVLPTLAKSADLVAKGVSDAKTEVEEINALSEEFERFASTSSFSLDQLLVAFKNLRIEIGEQFGPIFQRIFDSTRAAINTFQPVIIELFDELATSLEAFVNSFTGGSEETEKRIRSFAKTFTESIKAIFTAVTLLATVISKAIDLLLKLGEAIPGVSAEAFAAGVILLQLSGGITALISVVKLARAAFILFWAAALGPAGAIAALLAGLALIVAALFDFEGVVNKIKAAWAGVVSVVKKAAQFISKIFGGSQEKTINVNVNEKKTTEEDAPNVRRFADGGKISGAGTGTSDSILAKVSHGEYIVKASAVKKLGTGFLNSINQGVVPRLKGFASGGMVGSGISSTALAPVTASAPQTGRPITLVLPSGQSVKTFTNDSAADLLQRELRRGDMATSYEQPHWDK